MNLKELEEFLEKEYKMQLQSIIKNTNSTDGNVYNIDTNDKKYIVKAYNSKQHAESMVKLYSILKENKIKAPLIIKNITGEDFAKNRDKHIIVYTYIDGISLDKINITDTIIKQVAEYLRKLHKINSKLTLEEVTFNLKPLKNSILHFDITKSNIFIKNNEIVFIDFDDAKYGPSIYDVGIAIANLFISRKKRS